MRDSPQSGLHCGRFRTGSFAAQGKAVAPKQSKEIQQETKTMTADQTAKTSTEPFTALESYEPASRSMSACPAKLSQRSRSTWTAKT